MPHHGSLEHDGAVHVPNALGAEAMSLAEACWRWSMANPSPSAARLYTDALVLAENETAARALDDRESFFYQDIGHRNSWPAYEALATHPEVLAIVAELFGPGAPAWFLGEQVFLKEENGAPTGWHQDISDVSATGADLVALWITLDAVARDGALEFVRGSHAGPTYSSIYGQFRAEDIPDIEADRAAHDVFGFACDPGDVVAFHLGALHGGGATPAGVSRRTVALRYVGPRAYFESMTRPDDARNGTPFRPDRPRVL